MLGFRRTYNPLLSIVTFCLICLVHSPILQGQQANLRWTNGDSLQGSFLSFGDDTIVWESKLFSSPLRIDPEKIQQIVFPHKKTSFNPKKENHLVITNNGNQFYGTLLSVDDQTVSLTHKEYGLVRLARKSVVSITNQKNTPCLFDMAIDSHQLQFPFGHKNRLKKDENNQLTTTGKSCFFGRQLELPETVLFKFQIRAKKGFNVRLGFGFPGRMSAVSDTLRIETWVDSLVVVRGDNFEPIIDKIPTKETTLRFSIFLNRKTNRVIGLDENGKIRFNTIFEAGRRKMDPGFFIDLRNNHSTLENFRITPCSEKSILSKSEIVLKNQDPKDQTIIKSFDGRKWTFVNKTGTETTVPDEHFQAATLSSTPQKADRSNLTKITMRDQTELFAKIVRGDLQNVIASIPESGSPISIPKNSIHSLQFNKANSPSETSESTSILYSDGGKLRGALADSNGKDPSSLRWRPPGAKEAVSLAGTNSQIQLPNGGQSNQKARFRDTVFMRNRDVVPCTVLESTPKETIIQTFSGKRTIPQEYIHAVQLDGGKQYTLTKFHGGKWNWRSGKNVLQTPDKDEYSLELDGASFINYYPDANVKHISFDLEWFRPSDFEFSIFDRRWMNFLNSYHLHLSNKQVDFRVSQFGQITAQKRILRDRKKIRVTMEYSSVGGIRILLDNKLVHESKYPDPNDMQKPSPQISFRTKAQTKIRLSNCLVGNKVHSASPTRINEDKKKHILTVPRFRENDPSTHILLSFTGDLLRGRLVKLDQESVVFESQLQKFRFPRTVVSSIITLIKKDSQDKIKNTHIKKEGKGGLFQIVFGQHQRFTLKLKQFKNNVLTGSHPFLGECAIPVEQIQEIRQGKFANQAMDYPFADWYAVNATKPEIPKGKNNTPQKPSPLIGKTADPFVLDMIDGSKFNLEEHKGKVVVLDFWATWCNPCVQSMPNFIATKNSFDPSKVSFVAVNLMEKVDQVTPFVKSQNWKIPIALDRKGTVSESFGANSIPHTVIIDRKGKITFVKTGSSPDMQNVLTKEVRKALSNE